ncbi:hypothetical protein ABE42_15875 [Bacillus thuringiensis]|nr:hypothetical protein [Bacillus thuringiensis]MBG9486756.1 hypothetical protein [Bacillus thuringiensis]MBG9580641.1 hypothetical protein [Bacillus thuringiensis]
MKTYKKLATLAPIAVLSTSILVSPVMTFAAEKSPTEGQTIQKNVAQQNHIIQGYLIKNGIKTPIYKGDSITDQAEQTSDAPYPQLSSNPNDAIPNAGATHTENGNIGSILYFQHFNFFKLGDIKNTVETDSAENLGVLMGLTMSSNVYIEKQDNGTFIFGKYDPLTLQKKPSMTVNSNDNLKSLFDSTITRDTFFSKVGSGVVPKNGTYTFSQAVTSGLTTSDAIGGALTLGYKVSVTEGGGIFPAAASEEFSAQLTASYNHTITVSSQVTNTQTLSNPKAPDGYQYDKYVGAVYQLKSIYKMNPSSKLNEFLTNGTANLDNRAQSFQYDDSTLYLAVTPGAGN